MAGNFGYAGRGLVSGMVIVVIGAVLLLDNMGIVPARVFFRFWPLLLIVAGVMRLLHGFGSGSRIFGAFLILGGVIAQLNELNVVHVQFQAIWPIFLIVLGGMLIAREVEARARPKTSSSSEAQINQTDHTAIFSGFKQRVTSGDFKGGSVTAIFGGFELDLRHANVQGSEAVIDATAICGGGEIRIPETWDLSIQAVAILGGYSDETQHPPQDPSVPAKRLVLKGVTLLGGVSIKN